jgi:hypothetical protein
VSRTSFLVVILLMGSMILQTTGTAKRESQTESRAPVIKSFAASNTRPTLCPFTSVVSNNNETTLRTDAFDPDGDPLTYTYLVPAGTIEGNGSTVVWNLKQEPAGTYRAAVRVEDSQGNKVYAMLTVTAVYATSCHPPPPKCPQVSVDCPSEVESGNLITFTVTVSGGEPLIDPYYRWNTDAGRIVDGKLQKKMTLDLMRFPFEKVTATITVGGYDPACSGTEVSCTTRIKG